jgi:murein DD-endopeptidase MepM/ murein hydrolase activator NlpD
MVMLPVGVLQHFPVRYHRHQVASGQIAPPRSTARGAPRHHEQIWFADSFDQPRNGGANRHDAIDIFGPIGVPVVAAVPGTVAETWRISGRDRPGVGATGEGDGGFYVVLIGLEGGLYHYFSHLNEPPRLSGGDRVGAGQILGYLGHSGKARGNPHLHYQISRRSEAGALRRFYNPYSELRRTAGRGAVTHRTNTRVEIPVSSGGPL